MPSPDQACFLKKKKKERKLDGKLDEADCVFRQWEAASSEISHASTTSLWYLLPFVEFSFSRLIIYVQGFKAATIMLLSIKTAA